MTQLTGEDTSSLLTSWKWEQSVDQWSTGSTYWIFPLLPKGSSIATLRVVCVLTLCSGAASTQWVTKLEKVCSWSSCESTDCSVRSRCSEHRVYSPSQPCVLVTKVFHKFWCSRTAASERGLSIFSALSCVLSFSVCLLGWRNNLCSWNVLQAAHWLFHSGIAYLEAPSISKLRLNDQVVDDCYIKWSVELNPDFFFKYTWLLVLLAQRWWLAVIPVGCGFLAWVRLGGTSM